jgi:pseudouridylate synthase
MAMKIRVSQEVSQALTQEGALVALESSVIAQGLPYPENLHSARACEEAIRRAGAIPVTTAVIDGQVCAGLTNDELRRLAEEQGHRKIASRDLAIAVAQKATGGTTVSATCEIAAAVGVRVFATGGIGGIHRGVAEHLDISQDLWALSRFPVAVVCAGAKSVLDLPKTLEALEALAVPVIGVGTREFPSFYSQGSGIELEHSVADPASGAELMQARFGTLRQGGMIFAVPPPTATALSRDEVEAPIEAALKVAQVKGVKGKAVTPFLLSELARVTGGKTLQANLALLQNNARFAGELAAAFAARP